MRSRVDSVRSNDPAAMTATPGIHEASGSARNLIMENFMRLTILAGLALLSGACVADVGSTGSSRGGRGSGSGSGSDDADGPCERVETPVTIKTWTDFDKLPKGCWELYAKLTIQGSEITSIAKLNGLVSIDELELSGTGLTKIDSQHELEVYGPLKISANPKLTSLDKLVGKHLGTTSITGNAALTDVKVLATVDRLYGDLTITGNPALTTAALNTLVRIDGNLTVNDTTTLVNLDLNRLTTISNLELSNNLALTTISGLPATSINGDMTLRGNRALSTIGTMSALYRITGSLTIDDNDALTNLSAFPQAMKFIDGTLTITNNQVLSDISPMRRLAGIGPSITITGNPNLSVCRAFEVPNCVPGIGPVIIQNNKSANNCNTQCN